MDFNINRGDPVIGTYPEIPSNFKPNPNTDPIGPGNDDTFWYYFFEVVVFLDGNFGVDFNTLQTSEREGNVTYDLGGGRTITVPYGQGTRNDSPDPPFIYNDGSSFLTWLDAPGFPRATLPHGQGYKAIAADVTWTFTFAAISRSGGGCSGAFDLHVSFQPGDTEPRWEITNVRILP
jgi:hypothetical protein